jgi:hypothetical protein
MDLQEHLATQWLSKLKLASDHKEREFGFDAEDAMRFYHEDHDFLYNPMYLARTRNGVAVSATDGGFPTPWFKMTVNKVSELVQLFLPVLYHRNPTRQVNPRRIEFPAELLMALQMQPNPATLPLDIARAKLIEYYLNFTPHELDLCEESRKALVEALIKGRGILWTMLYDGPRGRMVGSFYDTVDNLLIDPDAEDVRYAQWIARKHCEPVWKVERKYGLPTGTLKPTQESLNATGDQMANPMQHADRAAGRTNDQIVYYEIFSRMGIGGRLNGFGAEGNALLQPYETDNAYLVVAQGTNFLLNAPLGAGGNPDPEAAKQDLQARFAWPTPFHVDQINPWPFTELDFHTIPRKTWPMAHVKPGMGYQKFLDWAYSFLAGKVKNTCKDRVVVPKDVPEIITALQSTGDLAIIPVDVQNSGQVRQMIEWLQCPPMNGDILTVIEMAERGFEKATGMGELMYGQTAHQYRSATEADVKQGNMNVRPDYMAERVESWATRVAAKEGIAARYHLDANDVAPLFGEAYDPLTQTASGPYTQKWMELVRQDDMLANAAELEYRIEAGSARKPNKQRDIANIDESAQIILPALMQVYQMTGDPTQVNAWLREWARTRDMDPSLIEMPDLRQMMAQQQAMAMQQQAGQQPPQPPPGVAA